MTIHFPHQAARPASGHSRAHKAWSLLAWLLLTLGALSGSAAMAAYNVWTSEYSFTRQELQRGLASQFPRDLSYYELVGIRLSDPRLSFDGSRNRVVTRFKARLSSPMLLPEPINGVMIVSSGLKYDSASRSVQLVQPKLEKIDVPGLPADVLAQLNMMGATISEQMLANYPLYTFSPEQLKLNGQRFEPGAIRINSDTIVVEIRPLP